MTPRRHPLEEALGYTFKGPDILTLALTHRSSLGMERGKSSTAGNERLEFLGDRVLGLLIAETLLRTFPNENEGALAARLAHLASAGELTRVAETIELADYLKVARTQAPAVVTTSVLADGCEALIGALYLDGGLDAARTFIAAHWAGAMTASSAPPKDSKMALQEWAQGRGLPLPIYRDVAAEGPDHAPSFTMCVSIEGGREALGKGRTKRIATQAAAAALLAQLTETKS